MANKTVKTDSWERQQGESTQAYEAFATYRDMGTERSIRSVAQKLGKSSTIIGRWSSTWKWVDRVREWDNELAREAKAKAVKKVKDMTDRHVNLAMQLQKKALEELQTLSIGALAPKDILAFIEKAAALERLNRLEQAGIESGGKGVQKSDDSTRSLADSIVSAYERRKESGDND